MKKRWLKLILRNLLFTVGAMASLMIGLAFTRIPFDAHRWLRTACCLCASIPFVILVLGGSGMPSGPELMRCNMAGALALDNPDAEVVLLLPNDTGLARAMTRELMLKGVTLDRIAWLLHGRNTREQALNLFSSAPELRSPGMTLVSAPENMYRSLLTFRKAGFSNVCGSPAFDHALFDDLAYAHDRIGGKTYAPDVSRSLDLRYNFWNQLKLEITCMREYAALAYYKLNAWI